jgi:hypothetical protein
MIKDGVIDPSVNILENGKTDDYSIDESEEV